MSVLTTTEARQRAAAAGAQPRAAAQRRPMAGVPIPHREPVRRTEVERPPLHLVEPAARPRRLSVGLLGTACLVAVFLGLFALAAMHSLVVQAQFELDRVDQSVADRRAEIEARRVEVAQRESPAAVVGAAQELGMVEPADRRYLLPAGPADG